jgi:hypothetical protein
MMTLTRDLTESQREAAVARALKKCRFGRQHGWCTELDLAGDGHFTGWCVCYDCGARDWEGREDELLRVADAFLVAS